MLKKDLKKITSIFLSTRILILMIGYLSSLIILKGKWFHGNSGIIKLFFRWDSQWYESIILNGYSYVPGQESNVAFFPLYPLLTKLFSYIFQNRLLTGFIISNVSLFLAAIYLFKITKLDQDSDTAINSVIFFLIFPLTFFYSIFYTEGLFIFLTISSFYYARKRNFKLAGIFGFFSALTRAVGVLIFIPLIFEYFMINLKFKINNKKIKKDILYLGLVPLGLFSYMFYLKLKFNDFFAFSHAAQAWGRKHTSVFKTLIQITHIHPFYKIIFSIFIILGIFLLIYMIYAKFQASYIIYSIILFYVYLSSNLLQSTPRYISTIFPMYMAMSHLSKKNQFLKDVLTYFFISFLTLFVILFVNGYWFI